MECSHASRHSPQRLCGALGHRGHRIQPDVVDAQPHSSQRFDHRVDRGSRIVGGVLVAGKALFLVIDDDARAGILRDFDQRNPGVVRARRPKPGNVNGFAAQQSFPDRGDRPVRESSANAVKAVARQPPLAEQPREVITGPCDAGMPRPDAAT